MFLTGLLIGIYSYVILVLGLLSRLNVLLIILVTILFLTTLFWGFRKKFAGFFVTSVSLPERIILLTFFLLATVNIVGALGPETAFDALWYQLMIPRLFIEAGKIYFPSDNLFYYALMPKLGGMLYVSALSLFDETAAKLIHFLFGLLTSFVVFRIFRIYFNRKISIFAALVFYASPVVSWLSITSYVDLIRSFYESIALFFFLKFVKLRDNSYIYKSSIMLGFAICTKILSFGTIPVFLVGILLTNKNFSILKKIKLLSAYFFITALIPLPWFLISYYYTKNPFYPLFSNLQLRNFSFELLNPFVFVKTFMNIFLFGPDPLLPFYLMILPLVGFTFFKLVRRHFFVLLYVVLTYVVWYTTSQSGGTRFLVPFLPGYLLIGFLAIKELKEKFIKNLTYFVTYIFCIVTIGYRGIANSVYLPVLIGLESKEEFLLKRLNFQFGDFYDENREIKKIVKEQYVLLVNMHNLYYVDFNFVLTERDKRWDGQYILVQNGQLPEKFKKAKIIYNNSKTLVVLYKL